MMALYFRGNISRSAMHNITYSIHTMQLISMVIFCLSLLAPNLCHNLQERDDLTYVCLDAYGEVSIAGCEAAMVGSLHEGCARIEHPQLWLLQADHPGAEQVCGK